MPNTDSTYLLKNIDGALLFQEVSEIPTWDHDENSIDANYILVYAKDDGNGNTRLFTKDKAGVESDVVSGTKTVALSWNAADGSATTGTKKAIFSVPASMDGMNLISVHAELATAGITGTETIDINKNGTSMLTTVITVDSTETGSDTAATPAVINTAADHVATHDVISVDVDAIHSGTAGQGEVITLEFQTP